MLYKTILTIGLNDKDQEKQIIPTDEAKRIIAEILINKKVEAFTMFDCMGVYKMNSSGNIVQENSIRIEHVDDGETIIWMGIVKALKKALNQESIMIEIIDDVSVMFR